MRIFMCSLLFSVGCATTELPPEDAVEAYHEALCDHRERCGIADDFDSPLVFTPSAAECERGLPLSIGMHVALFSELSRREGFRWDDAAALDCLDELEGLGCDYVRVDSEADLGDPEAPPCMRLAVRSE